MNAPGTEHEIGLTETLTTPRPRDRPFSLATVAPAQAFSVSRTAKRFRRPTDVTLLIVTSALLLWFSARADGVPSGIHAALITFLDNLPGLLSPLWRFLHDWLLVWGVILVLLAAYRRHWSLVRDQLLAVIGVYLGVAIIGRLAIGTWPDLWDGLLQRSRPTDFPPLAVALAVALISVTSPHLSRPLRYAGRWFVVIGALSTAIIGITIPSHAAAGVVLGWAVAAAVHLLFGSPGGYPSLERVRLGLSTIGVDATPHDVSAAGGVVWVHATGADGTPLDVKVYGRDAWDGQFLVGLWRFIWYRDSGPTLALSRLQQVEHEAFMSLIAERRGVPVARVLSAGLDSGGDALLVAERFGVPIGEVPAITDAQLDAAWRTLAALHDAGIAHGRLDLQRVRVDGDSVRLADFSGAELAPDLDEQLIDRAQLLVVTAIVAGADRAVDRMAVALTPSGAAEVASLVQPAALTTPMRRAAEAAGIDIDKLRTTVDTLAGEPGRDLVKLRRVSVGGLLVTALFFVAMWMLVSGITDIGIDTIWEAMRSASWPVLVLAFLIGLTPRVTNAMALTAASPSNIPLARFTALQFAITFVNLAMPSSAARAAVVIRFFQRSGVQPTAAVAIGVLDSVAQFLAQITLVVGILVFGIGSLDLDLTSNFSANGLVTLLWWLLAILVVAVLVVLLVPKLRALLFAAARKGWEQIGPLLKSPRRLIKMYAYNMSSELLFALCMYTVLRAFNQDVGYLDVVAVNVVVALFAGLMPVPGGVGVTEAALTAGFIAIGVDEATAFAAALTYRMLTFYTQPIIGFGAFQWLKKQKFL